MFEVIPILKWSHYVSVPIPPHPRSSLGEGPGRPLFGERGRARHCSDATATGRVGKAVGDFTARRRSAKVRVGKTSVAKRHALKEAHRVHNAPEDTYERRRGSHGVCAPNAPSDTHAPRRSGFFKTSASPQWKKHRYSACTVRWCRGVCHVLRPKWKLKNLKSVK